MDDIKQVIKEYISLDDKMTELNKDIKEYRKSKNVLEENIKNYMIENGIAKVDLGSGSLRISKSKPVKKINKKVVLEVLKEHVEEQAETILDDIFKDSSEESEEIVKLERTKKK